MRPVRRQPGIVLPKKDREHVANRPLLDHKTPIRIGLAELHLRVQQDAQFGCLAGEAHGRCRAIAIADSESCAAGGRQPERPATNELPQKGAKQALHRAPPLNRPNFFRTITTRTTKRRRKRGPTQ